MFARHVRRNRVGFIARRRTEQAARQRTGRTAAGTAAEVQRLGGVTGKAAFFRHRAKCLAQPGLAQPRFAANVDHFAALGFQAGLDGSFELPAFASPTDQTWRGVMMIRQSTYRPHRNRAIESSDLGAAFSLGIDRRADRVVHRTGHERLAATGKIVQPRRQVHRRAGNGVFAVVVAPGAARDDFAAGHADMNAERRVERRTGLMDVDRGPHGAQRIVAMRDRRTEHRHHRIADMFIDRAAVAFDHGIGGDKKPLSNARVSSGSRSWLSLV